MTFDRPDSPLAPRLHPSPNVEPRCPGARPRLLILHYTGMTSAEKAIDWLARPESKVSCHYVVDETGLVTQMVPERLRAWHAGVSFWAGETDINSHSIGIEVHNPGHDLGYPDFPEAQMRAVERLSRDIVDRNGIPRAAVLAHSDVALGRKIDPGEKFDWERLARAGVGHWVAPVAVNARDPGLCLGQESPSVGRAQCLLRAYGYRVETHDHLDAATSVVIAAFQRHFRPARVDGRLDRSTMETLERLVETLAGGGSASNRA